MIKRKRFELGEYEENRSASKSDKEKLANLAYQLQAADEGWIKNNHSEFVKMQNEYKSQWKKVHGDTNYANPDDFANEKYIVWISKDGINRNIYGEYKSMRAAKMAMDKIWKSGEEYEEIGMKSKQQYQKEGFFKEGGITKIGRRASLEEQAIEAIGNNVWYSLDAAKQEEVVSELLRDGVISERIYEEGGDVWSDFVTDFEEDGSCYVLGSNETENNKVLAKLTPSNKIIYFNEEASNNPQVRELLLSVSNEGFANGGDVAEATKYLVKYKQKGAKTINEKTFTNKDEAELFWELLSEEEDVVLMPLEEVLPEKTEKPKKESLFAKAKPVTKTAASKSKRQQVEVDGIADKIYRYDQLKAEIKNATAEKEVIGRILKDIGSEKFLEIYEEKGARPDNFDLVDGEQSILLEVTDAYLKVEEEKEQILKEYDGLLEETIIYKFEPKLLDKETESGMTIGEIVSNLIENSNLISEEDKAKLIQAERTIRVKKGTINRLLEYDNPRQIFDLVSPILALK